MVCVCGVACVGECVCVCVCGMCMWHVCGVGSVVEDGKYVSRCGVYGMCKYMYVWACTCATCVVVWYTCTSMYEMRVCGMVCSW